MLLWQKQSLTSHTIVIPYSILVNVHRRAFSLQQLNFLVNISARIPIYRSTLFVICYDIRRTRTATMSSVSLICRCILPPAVLQRMCSYVCCGWRDLLFVITALQSTLSSVRLLHFHVAQKQFLMCMYNSVWLEWRMSTPNPQLYITSHYCAERKV